MAIVLPYPPSVNGYWRTFRNRQIISKRGREYRKAVQAAVGIPTRHTGRLAVSILLFPPDRRRRDLDNALKAALDGMAHAGLYDDDSQIDRLEVQRCAVEPPGKLFVTIRRMP